MSKVEQNKVVIKTVEIPGPPIIPPGCSPYEADLTWERYDNALINMQVVPTPFYENGDGKVTIKAPVPALSGSASPAEIEGYFNALDRQNGSCDGPPKEILDAVTIFSYKGSVRNGNGRNGHS